MDRIEEEVVVPIDIFVIFFISQNYCRFLLLKVICCDRSRRFYRVFYHVLLTHLQFSIDTSIIFYRIVSSIKFLLLYSLQSIFPSVSIYVVIDAIVKLLSTISFVIIAKKEDLRQKEVNTMPINKQRMMNNYSWMCDAEKLGSHHSNFKGNSKIRLKHDSTKSHHPISTTKKRKKKKTIFFLLVCCINSMIE